MHKRHLWIISLLLVGMAGCQPAGKARSLQSAQRARDIKEMAGKGYGKSMGAATSPVYKTAADDVEVRTTLYKTKKSQQDQHLLVRFGLDSDKLSAEDKAKIRAIVAKAKHANQHVKVNGYTCELGGAEYNISLGFRRAKAVATLLQEYGLNVKQITLVSYGKEKPLDPRHVPQAWTKNRRAEIWLQD